MNPIRNLCGNAGSVRSMADAAEQFKINLNQNLWGLLVSFGFLGAAEYYELSVLFWFSVVPASAMVISICITSWSYTKNYVSRKAVE